ncbi:helix-turn-helix domain-containing protein [Anaerophaga thermohalophila]|uniref:helix-turn-helix domain-containing protein n=1 Tax=Anaerophaga thermohalophila TaxID=177400 RepID=UPI001FDF84E9|nr:AraC family transcriptional regulator [Anaerophaga thermohalophila]
MRFLIIEGLCLFLKKVMSLVERNVENPDFSVDMISETLGMSSTHLYRKLKAITGQSTRDIINNYRMQKAANMLKNKDGNITEIMYAVGYTSLSSFSKSFKAKFGVSPKGYK